MNQPNPYLDDRQVQFVIDMLKQGHTVKIQVYGDSMHPSILSGSDVYIQSIAYKNLSQIKKGELILCLIALESSHPHWVLHRVLSHQRKQKTLLLGGERLPINDDIRSYDQVLGRVIRINSPPQKLKLEHFFSYLLARLTQKSPQSMISRYLGLLNLYLYRLYRRLKS